MGQHLRSCKHERIGNPYNFPYVILSRRLVDGVKRHHCNAKMPKR